MRRIRKKSLFIIGTDKQWEERALLAAAKVSGMSAKFLYAGDLFVGLDKTGPVVFHGNRNITRAFRKSCIIFRRTRGIRETMVALAELAQFWNISHTDSPRSIMANLDKRLSVAPMELSVIRSIPTLFIEPHKSILVSALRMSFPLLSKPALGRHGEGIRIHETDKDLYAFLKRNREPILLQPLLSIDEEFRVFCIGDRSLGAVLKIPKKGSLVANYAAGAKFVKATLPIEVSAEVARICKALEIDIGGIDLARVGKSFYLLEVNRCPEFKAFSNATSKDVAKEIVRFVVMQ